MYLVSPSQQALLTVDLSSVCLDSVTHCFHLPSISNQWLQPVRYHYSERCLITMISNLTHAHRSQVFTSMARDVMGRVIVEQEHQQQTMQPVPLKLTSGNNANTQKKKKSSCC